MSAELELWFFRHSSLLNSSLIIFLTAARAFTH